MIMGTSMITATAIITMMMTTAIITSMMSILVTPMGPFPASFPAQAAGGAALLRFSRWV
jgi:hypothetical protein